VHEPYTILKSRLRFPRSHKIVTKADYNVTLNQPYKISQKYLLVLFKPNQFSHGRLGLMVGKRVAAHAVTRNRIKRVIRESFRAKQTQLKGFDIVVIARHQCGTLSKVELRKGIDKLWEKLFSQYQDRSSS
jgi:ribonuclease P protein component